MLAILNNNKILSKEGNAVYGRFYVFQKDTNRKADVYTYDANNSLVKAQNPVYTDNFGFPEFEVILDNQIYSIVVEEYLGDYDDPKTDERPGVWNVCNSYYLGVVDEDKTEGVVYSAASIGDADIEAGEVNVVGYYTPFDCEERKYLWDPTSVDSVDNGYVFRSNKSSTGRWILLNNLPWIPSEYYGVYPGHLENINKLTSCPETLGNTYSISVPNSIKFATGTYELREMLLTNTNGRSRSIIVDNQTCFGTNYTVSCNGIEVLGEIPEGNYIGKLLLPWRCEARYSWFPSLDSFLDCGWRTENLVVDSYGIDNELKSNHTLSNALIKFVGGKIDFTGSGSLTLDSCTIIGERQSITNGGQTATWNAFSWKTKFKNMEVSDKFVLEDYKPTCENCTFKLANFRSVVNFIGYKLAANQTEIDLAGGHVETTVISQKTDVTLINGNFDNLSTYNVQNVTLRNSYVGSIRYGSGIKNIHIYNSMINSFEQASASTLDLFEVENSRVIQGTTGVNAVTTSIVGSLINCSITSSGECFACDSFTSTITAEKLNISNCSVNGSVNSYDIHANECTFHFAVWPKAKQNGNKWVINANINNCTFRNPRNGGVNKGILLKREGNESQVYLQHFYVTNCSFTQTGPTDTGYTDGIEVEVLGGHEERYLHDDEFAHTWKWSGNTGNCLKEFYRGQMKADLQSNEYFGDFRFISFGIPLNNDLQQRQYLMKWYVFDSSSSSFRDSIFLIPGSQKLVESSLYRHQGLFQKYDYNDYFKNRFYKKECSISVNAYYFFEVTPLYEMSYYKG